jgi:Aerotolerance regulator N-terminal/von Willebrand factor type A domain/CARDB
VSFLHPAILAGLAAVSVPIAIHFFNKFRVQKTRWAAMRFLQESVHQSRRRLQVEDLLLLVLRCLVVIALALAFAQPVLRSLAPDAVGADGPSTVAVLLDNSASMGQSNGIETRFEQGRKAIREELDHWPANSQAALYLVSNQVSPLVAQPGSNFSRFRRSLELATLSDRSTDLAQGIRAAGEALKASPSHHREIAVYTDSQSSAWKGLDEIQQFAREHPDITLKPVILGHGGEENLAVVGLQSEGGVPAAHQACRFRVDVANFGKQAAEGVRVTLSADGEAPSDETLIPHLEPGATQSVSLHVRFAAAGFHGITATIPPDRLPVDNQRSIALQVVDRLHVLLVEGSTEAPLAEQSSYFLANALAPVPSTQSATFYVKIHTTPLTSLAQTSLAASDVVFLCNPGAISDPIAQSLKTYVHDGGNLVIFPGPKTDPAKWNASLSDLLPATLGTLKKAETPLATLQPDGFDHPVTTFWNDRNEGGLNGITFTGYFPLDPVKADVTTGRKPMIILRLSNGLPAVIESPFGHGRVVIFNSAATPQWNNLPLHPAFVPLMQRLMGYLTRQQSARLVLAPGETFELPVPMELLGKDFAVIRPGPDTTKRPAGRVDLDDQKAVIRYRDTENVGAYRIFIGSDDRPAAVFAVQMDPAESDLRQEEDAKIDNLKRAPQLENAPASVAPSLKVSHEFWTLLIWLAAILALLEAALAHHFSHSR